MAIIRRRSDAGTTAPLCSWCISAHHDQKLKPSAASLQKPETMSDKAYRAADSAVNAANDAVHDVKRNWLGFKVCCWKVAATCAHPHACHGGCPQLHSCRTVFQPKYLTLPCCRPRVWRIRPDATPTMPWELLPMLSTPRVGTGLG
jgi:hypothetical protein